MTLLEKDLPDIIRNVISSKDAFKLLDQIKDWQGKPKAEWKARAEAHQQVIDAGDPFECAKVVKGLNQMEVDGTLRPRDRAQLNQSMDLLTEELARALQKPTAHAGKLIAEAISS